MTQLNAMTAETLARHILNGAPLFILDVRNEEAFAQWHIEGKQVELMNAPYVDLLDGVESIADRIPDDRPVVVVCAKEGSSIFVAEQLLQHGGIRQISYLEGGMKAWSEHVEPVKLGELKAGGAIYQFNRLGKGCLSYMIISGQEALVVDAARMTDGYSRFARDNGVTIRHTVDTHLHADHISGGRALALESGGRYWLPPKDAGQVRFAYEPLEEGATIQVGETSVTVTPIYSPGHTIGSTTLLVDGRYMLTGDILFVQSIGRPDLAGQAEDWAGDLRRTLYSTYQKLDADNEWIVLPAHFSHTDELNDDGTVHARLSELYYTNAGLNIASDADFRTLVTTDLPPQPNAYQDIRRTNMGHLQPSTEEQQEMETGPNRCAVHR
ncbi:MAG: hypothetical protein K0Q59_1236 [Paenibacillus sp.]|jgi:glyoxylase-like metal-dependent hydrolase (beta-lactamase superfamily II)|nr:hypothetical protein [Paenibacillus sp.]